MKVWTFCFLYTMLVIGFVIFDASFSFGDGSEKGSGPEGKPEITEPYQVQLRTRDNTGIIFKTVDLSPSETLFLSLTAIPTKDKLPQKPLRVGTSRWSEWGHRFRNLLFAVRKHGNEVYSCSIVEIERSLGLPESFPIKNNGDAELSDSPDSLSVDELRNKIKSVQNIVFLGDSNDIVSNDSLSDAGLKVIQSLINQKKNIIVMRDLFLMRDDDPEIFARPTAVKAIRDIEKQGVASFTSDDLLREYIEQKRAFRFSDDENKQSHVSFLVSDDHYNAEKLLPVFAETLEDEFGYYCTIIHGEGTNRFSRLGELATTDSLVIYIRRLALPKDQLRQVKEYVESGKGVVGMRTASHGFVDKQKTLPIDCENWNEFDHDILGGNYNNHGKNELGSLISNVSAMEESEILRNVRPSQWKSAGSLYWTAPVLKDATIYQIGSSLEGENIPVTWTRMYKKTKVAYTALGNPEDFEVETALQLFKNLIQWTLSQ
ncbi:MAG: ThuA domain-containing protein [Thermoguttaceae bacterium]